LKRFFNNNGIRVIVIAAVCALVMTISAAVWGGHASIITNIAGVIVSPVENGVTGIVNWFGSIYAYMYEYDAVKAENEELKKQIAEMEAEIRISLKNNEENERLRQLLGLQEQRSDFEFESAAIISWGTSNWTSTFTIGKGTSSGLEPYDCVITETGALVGIVSEVGTNWATVTTIIDTDIEIGALIFRTGETSIAEGDFDLMQEGCLKLSYLSEDCELLNGDLIMTSGKGGVYPSGLMIGTIERVKTEATGITKYAVIRPTADLDNITQVFVIKSFDIVD